MAELHDGPDQPLLISCRRAQRRFLDGRVLVRVAEHLNRCPACRRAAADFQWLVSLLAPDREVVKPSDG